MVSKCTSRQVEFPLGRFLAGNSDLSLAVMINQYISHSTGPGTGHFTVEVYLFCELYLPIVTERFRVFCVEGW
jgi:hypothetical protein